MGNWDSGMISFSTRSQNFKTVKTQMTKPENGRSENLVLFWFFFPSASSCRTTALLGFSFSLASPRHCPFFFLPRGPIGNWTRSTLSLSQSLLSGVSARCRPATADISALCVSLPLSLSLSLSLPPGLSVC
jgi:hypothetical protein